MNTPQTSPSNLTSSAVRRKKIIRISLHVILPILIVAGSIGFLKYQVDTRPQAERKKPPRQAYLVTVEPVQRTVWTTSVTAMGKVTAAKEVTLSPEVTGVITRIDPEVVPGGVIEKGQLLFEIDSRDYQAVVTQRESDLARARLELKLETGNQSVARQEYKMLEEIIEEQDKELVLREPHLENAQAALGAAQAALDKARLDVQRCTIEAPFNAVIMEKFADLGARVSPASPLISILGTDEYWVEAAVPMDQLSWIRIPKDNGHNGSAVKIYNSSAWGESVYREGYVIRLLSQLEEEGRMARLLVTVEDPLELNQSQSGSPLLIGTYVRADIEGKPIQDVFPIGREYLRDGNTVWVINADNKLEIRPVEIVFRSKEIVCVTEGLSDGDRIVTSDIPAPVEGMELRMAETPAGQASAQPAEPAAREESRP
jgi:RND family efflux transporter MFP subunit